MKKRIVSYLLAGVVLAATPIANVLNTNQPVSLAWQIDLPDGQQGGTGGGSGTTEFLFEPKGSTIKDGEVDVPQNALIMLLFSNNVSGEEVLDQNAEKISVVDSKGNDVEITVTSVPEGKVVSDVFLYRRYLSINIKNREPGETYTIKVAPGIQAKNGSVLEEGYEISFTYADKEEIVLDASKAYLSGYPDGSIKPDSEITRAEVSRILKSAIKSAPDVEDAAVVSDVEEGWYKDYVDFVIEKGLMKGYEDGTFRPDDKMTRAEFVTAIAKLKELKKGGAPFSDIEGHWALDYIISAYNNSLIKGYEDGSFRPDNTITRAEAATIMNGILNKKADLEEEKDKIKQYTDLTESHWGYVPMITATLEQ